jgi:hypothetical protein
MPVPNQKYCADVTTQTDRVLYHVPLSISWINLPRRAPRAHLRFPCDLGPRLGKVSRRFRCLYSSMLVFWQELKIERLAWDGAQRFETMCRASGDQPLDVMYQPRVRTRDNLLIEHFHLFHENKGTGDSYTYRYIWLIHHPLYKLFALSRDSHPDRLL